MKLLDIRAFTFGWVNRRVHNGQYVTTISADVDEATRHQAVRDGLPANWRKAWDRTPGWSCFAAPSETGAIATVAIRDKHNNTLGTLYMYERETPDPHQTQAFT